MIDEQYVDIDELKYPIGNGSTKPIVGLSSNNHYIIKTNNNAEGNKTLINEYVCYLLALKLELPMPKSGICVINNDTYIDANVKAMEEFSDDCYGLGFYSEYIDNATVLGSDKMLKIIGNHEWLIPKLMLFDHLIYNKDRNKGNLLIKTGKKYRELILIDHSHTFNLETMWDNIQLRLKIESEDYKDEYIMEQNAYIYSIFKKVMDINMIVMSETLDYFNSKLNFCVIKDIIDRVPKEWVENKEDLEALKEYLIYRFKKLNHFVDIISYYKY